MADVSLDARVGRLERENRRLRAGTVAVLAVVVGLVCVAATKPAQKVVRAQRFEVVDAKGKVWATLDVRMGLPALRLLGSNGKPRAELAPYLGGLCLFDNRGMARALLAVDDEDGSPVLNFFHKDGNWSAQLGELAGNLGLVVWRKPGKLGAVLGLNKDGIPGLYLTDDEAKARAMLEVHRDGTAGLALGDKDMKAGALLSVGPDGKPRLEFDDKDGKVLWKAPPD
jgi:hypothetical protein